VTVFGQKGTTWEGGQRVPCIMYWPGKIKGGIVSDAIVSSMDFYPTFARLGQGEIPNDRIIDGLDLSSLLFEGGVSPRNTFFYYLCNNLEAVREGRWKLHVRKGKDEVKYLFDLEQDVGEAVNLYDKHPEIVERLQVLLEECRNDLGDASSGVQGKNIRPIGRVDEADSLTHYNPDHPYIIAMYDLPDRG
jgi:arylsulfatase A